MLWEFYLNMYFFFLKKKTRLAQVSSQYTSSVSLTTKWAEQT